MQNLRAQETLNRALGTPELSLQVVMVTLMADPSQGKRSVRGEVPRLDHLFSGPDPPGVSDSQMGNRYQSGFHDGTHAFIHPFVE